MSTRTLEQEGSRLLAATSWGAIASGVFVALALQTLLLLLGLAFGVSVGDRALAGGFAWWGFLVQLFALGVGGALAARISHASSRFAGVVSGAMTWAAAVVVGGAFGGLALGATVTQLGAAGAWAAFFGILLGLGAAVIGGTIGAGRTRGTRRSEERPITPIGGPQETPA